MYLHQRSKVVLKGSFSTLAAKGIGFLSQFFITSLFAHYLDAHSFGIWSILSSIALLLALFDFGITGQGLRNQLAEMTSPTQERKKQHLFLSVFYLSSMLYLFFGIVLLPWISCAIFLSLIRVPFVVNTNGFFAYQEAHLRGIFEALEFILLSVVAILGIFFKLPFKLLLPLYFFAFSLGPMISFFAFLKRRKWTFIPLTLSEMLKTVRPIAWTSIYFWVYSLCSLAFFALQPSLVAYYSNLEIAGDFSVVQKCFTLFLGVHFTFLIPLWSAYTQAFVQKDWRWVQKTFRKSFFFTLVLFGIGIPFMDIVCKPIVFLWTGKIIKSFSLIAATGSITFVFGIINVLSIFLNGLNQIRHQAIFLFFGLIISLILTVCLGQKWKEFGIVISFLIGALPLLFSNIWFSWKAYHYKEEFVT